MSVDKNLFLYDLAIVAIMKSEGPYIKEWIDYHLLAGVNHFYIYDNESPDNQSEVVKPYVEKGFVDYFYMPGKAMQYAAYNDAFKRFKFQCRYMTFIDGDEFILPKAADNIVDVVDDIFNSAPNIGELAVSWHIYGSNGQEKADYSRGVLERFTRRADDTRPNYLVKLITNPRTIRYIDSAHSLHYFEGITTVNVHKKREWTYKVGQINPIIGDTLVINHYYTKSREEYALKRKRGDVIDVNRYDSIQFQNYDRNEVFDDSILKYRDGRIKTYQQSNNYRIPERVFNALLKNLSPTFLPTTPKDFYKGKAETFLTCRAVCSYLQKKLPDPAPVKFLEEAALKAILKSIPGMTLADAELLINELPNILSLPYPVVNDIRNLSLQIISQLMNVFHLDRRWRSYSELDYTRQLLKAWQPK
ncbi:MAG: glycosyltransferase family 92 protein [Selenomonadaceae bacterium]|nr:glycosyltransferase family 92 protein [Selenomonadaceae bacterium]